MKNPAEQEEQVKRTLRIPKSLSDEIHAAAASRGVSVNAEITDRLRTSTVADQLTRLSLDMAELKALVREVLSVVE